MFYFSEKNYFFKFTNISSYFFKFFLKNYFPLSPQMYSLIQFLLNGKQFFCFQFCGVTLDLELKSFFYQFYFNTWTILQKLYFFLLFLKGKY